MKALVRRTRELLAVIFIGFAVEAGHVNWLKSVSTCGYPAVYVQATPDLVMGDLLKTMRSSQIFSVTGLPDCGSEAAAEQKGDPPRYQVELRGLTSSDPTTMTTDTADGSDVPAWFLDTNYNDLCFLVSQAFSQGRRMGEPEAGSRRLLRDSVGSTLRYHQRSHSWLVRPEDRVKVIDDRGNELLVVKSLDEADDRASSSEVPEPILSSPFEEPPEHWWIEEGKLPERRASAGLLATSPGSLAAPVDGMGSHAEEWMQLDLVNLIRSRWPNGGSRITAGATRTTRELIEYWRRDGRQWPLFFAQLEAVETSSVARRTL